MNKKLETAKNKWNAHKTKIVIGALAITTAGTALMFRNQREFNNFLKDHDLFETYYHQDEED